MTKWTSRKNQLVTPNQIISIISRGRRRRGNVTSPSSSRTIVSAPKPQIGTRTITGAILNNAAQSVEAEGGNSHIFEGGDSVDSSNEGKRTWNQHGGEISPVECDTSRCSDMKAQEDNRKVKAEATSSSREQAKMAARRKMLESGTNWKRRRFLKLDNASDATHEAKDTTAGEASKDDIPTEQEIEQRSIRMLEPPSPRTSRTRRSSLKRKAKERVFLTVETEDHDEVEKQKKVTFYGENNEEAKERKESKGSSSALSANDASLQQNLINLLYADHLRQASNDTKTGLITKMYEEYVQRSFSRCQNTNVGVLSLALAKRKQTARSIASIISDKKDRRAGNKLKTQTSRI
ncbi:hypothetical protein MPTK1_6g17250 [Marchantia polymorpha subsp. ruderalis]|nr:hypothetical protein MARPO_0184s0025 [Marchantia polymorpha]BBN15125.1 hypothetical protein Mp_6g17250 [Marchantia polymorpha subsp. ruderalis]|eukprot:PTQ27787.1 hypothetical protein MARPO_0184s0025 [Marchantia polymorpha]